MRSLIVLLFLSLSLVACSGRLVRGTPSPLPTLPPATAAATPTTRPTATVPALPTADVPPTSGGAPVADATATPSADSATSGVSPTLSPDDARAATARELTETTPPVTDEVRLAVAYQGADPVAAAATPPPPEALEVGAIETFWVRNTDSNTVSEITAELLAIGDNAYFWFDLDEDSVQPDRDDVAETAAAFDTIYDAVFPLFGTSQPPGGRVHVVSASASALCDDGNNCGLAGYFSDIDLLPLAVNPTSNERPMFVMNAWRYGGDRFLDTLTHELRHMLGAGYDTGDEDWFIEGAATFTQDLVGFSEGPQARGSRFLSQPDQQLNTWTDEDTIPYYGQGYLVNRFLYDRLGAALYREFTISPERGLAAVDAVAAAAGRDETGEQLWLDWLVAMAVHEDDDVAERYRWDGPRLGPLATTTIKSLPATFETDVHQYAADYYELPSSGSFRIEFAGAPTVSLLGSQPLGSQVWYAQRANEGNPRLTRTVDLREVGAATLTYRVFADIEHGYDYAYVAVSTDGGERWQPLTAANMQGLNPADDPSGSALAERYYTGRTQRWVEESIDLTPFAGQEILLRFEYVTDLLLTFGGLALDDIAIPEIGFRDDAEMPDAGWTAEGFTRATPDLPQRWLLQLVTFDQDGQPQVELLPVAADGRLQRDVQAVPGARRPLLIVAATAPETLQTADYSLQVTE